MKTFLLGTAALLALAAPAAAADMAPRTYAKAAPMVSPLYNWSGFYAGIHAGYTFGDRTGVDTTGQAPINVLNVLGGARPASVGLDRDGFIGGGQIGYNWQASSPWVWGLEADISYVDINSSRNVVTTPLSGIGALNNAFGTSMDYFGTVRGRVGYAWDRTMVYATGGFAYGQVENAAAFGGPAGQLQFVGSNRDTKTGYTVGGGVEHAWTGNWTVKAEYLYYDLGDTTVGVNVIPGSGGGGTGYNSSFSNDGHIVRAGLNYKLGGWGW
ncbi:MAG: outer membrane beta-barrel protein [Tardiphaga sp.]